MKDGFEMVTVDATNVDDYLLLLHEQAQIARIPPEAGLVGSALRRGDEHKDHPP